MTKYILKTLIGKDKRVADVLEYSNKKTALEGYQKYCEGLPKEKFWVIKQQIIEEIIAESDDYRQQRFEFAK
jgi:hypothetical protein